jgi:hypothetical protein
VGGNLVTTTGNQLYQFGLRRSHRPQNKKGGLYPEFIQQLQNAFGSNAYPPTAPGDQLFLLKTANMVPIFNIDGKGILKHSHPT